MAAVSNCLSLHLTVGALAQHQEICRPRLSSESQLERLSGRSAKRRVGAVGGGDR